MSDQTFHPSGDISRKPIGNFDAKGVYGDFDAPFLKPFASATNLL
jgi:hypothetical protein